MQNETMKISGMTCGSCVLSVQGVLKAVNGVADAQVTLDTGLARVSYDETQTSSEQLKSAVRNAGFGVEDA
ncbi:MAG TPA: heavy-metal-associated domain-containing protein [Methylophilaceae bacterium]|jgi:copper chaperone CopZ|nr:heavy-metal-associated domain-containing protein [Methylophilaceae bacterium]